MLTFKNLIIFKIIYNKKFLLDIKKINIFKIIYHEKFLRDKVLL